MEQMEAAEAAERLSGAFSGTGAGGTDIPSALSTAWMMPAVGRQGRYEVVSPRGSGRRSPPPSAPTVLDPHRSHLGPVMPLLRPLPIKLAHSGGSRPGSSRAPCRSSPPLHPCTMLQPVLIGPPDWMHTDEPKTAPDTGEPRWYEPRWQPRSRPASPPAGRASPTSSGVGVWPTRSAGVSATADVLCALSSSRMALPEYPPHEPIGMTDGDTPYASYGSIGVSPSSSSAAAAALYTPIPPQNPTYGSAYGSQSVPVTPPSSSRGSRRGTSPRTKMHRAPALTPAISVPISENPCTERPHSQPCMHQHASPTSARAAALPPQSATSGGVFGWSPASSSAQDSAAYILPATPGDRSSSSSVRGGRYTIPPSATLGGVGAVLPEFGFVPPSPFGGLAFRGGMCIMSPQSPVA